MAQDSGEKSKLSVEEQLMDLQMRLAYQEDAIDGLNRTVADQRSEIDSLQAQMKLLKEQWLEARTELTHVEEAFEKPPHY